MVKNRKSSQLKISSASLERGTDKTEAKRYMVTEQYQKPNYSVNNCVLHAQQQLEIYSDGQS